MPPACGDDATLSRGESFSKTTLQDALRLGIQSSRQSQLGGLLRDILLPRQCQDTFKGQAPIHSSESQRSLELLPLLLSTNPRGGSTATKTKTKSSRKKAKSKQESSKKKKKSDRPCALSATQPFMAPEQIGQLTLTDVGKAFEYARQSTQQGWDRPQYPAKQQLMKLFQAMERACATSRGGKGGQAAVTGTTPTDHPPPGDVDTLLFCAAARILSEWRLVRQVPEGHKRYASSMTLGHKDVLQNIGKMEAAAHAYMDAAAESNHPPNSPSLRQMLQFEVEQNYHPERPKLLEVSGAMGLLWVRRQLEFQTATFQNLLDIPTKIQTPAEALAVAYDHVYMNVHKWATQKVFRYTMQEGPEIHEVFECMNPKRLEAARAEGGPEEAPEVLEKRVWEAMEEDAHHHIRMFVKDIQPVLNDLAALFDEFNMNDPKKA